MQRCQLHLEDLFVLQTTVFSHPTSWQRIHWTLLPGGAEDLEDNEDEETDASCDCPSSSSTLDHDGGCRDNNDKDLSCSLSQSESRDLDTNQPVHGSEADTVAAMRVLLPEKVQEVSQFEGKVLLL